jgi:hypothetical protein
MRDEEILCKQLEIVAEQLFEDGHRTMGETVQEAIKFLSCPPGCHGCVHINESKDNTLYTCKNCRRVRRMDLFESRAKE